MQKQKGIAPIIIVLIIIALLAGGILAWQYWGVPKGVTFDELISNPEKYNGKTVVVEGFLFKGFEVTVLTKELEYSGFAEGHVQPTGPPYIWVSPVGFKEIDKLHKQEMMGPTERYGKVRITGLFEYGGKYGHLGQYDYHITSSKIEVLE